MELTIYTLNGINCAIEQFTVYSLEFVHTHPVNRKHINCKQK